MNISYTKINDYELPNLEIENKEKYNIGKYGLLKLEYLKRNKKLIYNELLIRNKLNSYLYEIDKTASNIVDILIKEMSQREIMNEELKNKNQLLWIGKMNNIKNVAEEIVCNDLIYN